MVNTQPIAVTIAGVMTTDAVYLTASPVYQPDADVVRVVGYAKEVGSISLLFPYAMWLATTSIAFGALNSIEGGTVLSTVSGLNSSNLSIAPTRTELTDNGRKADHWYVTNIASIV